MLDALSTQPNQKMGLGRLFGYLFLAVLVLGILAFIRQVIDYYHDIRSGAINAVFTQIYGSTNSPLGASRHVSKSDLLLLNASDAPSTGSSKAPITIVEFLDYGCPFCRQSFEHVRQLVIDRPQDVRLIIRDFPIEVLHPGAVQASMAARCVYRIDASKFWAYHDKLFLEQNFTTDSLKRYAQEIGVPVMAMDECLAEEETRSLVEKDISLGIQTGVQGTPTFFFNGRRIQGGLDREAFDAIIDEMLTSTSSAL